MSLIVARKFKGHIFVVSDTKLTYPDKEKNTPEHGLIKSINVTPNISISFAGDISYAEEALKQIQLSTDINHISEIILNTHCDSNQKTDFIIAVVGNDEPSIFVFRKGEKTKTETAWIGSSDGFDCFQKYFHDPESVPTTQGEITTLQITKMPDVEDKEVREFYSALFSAMRGVIEDSSVKEVGGFVVPVLNENGNFIYGSYAHCFRQPIDAEQEIPKNGQWATVQWGSAADGAFAVNFAGGKEKVVAIHFYQGNLGVIYSRENFGHMKPKMYPSWDEIDFVSMLKKYHDMGLAFTIQHNCGDYGAKGIKEYKNGNLKKSLSYFDTAVTVSSRQWGPEKNKESKFTSLSEYIEQHGSVDIPMEDVDNLKKILFHRGNVLDVLGNNEEALMNFRESLTLDATFFPAMLNKGLSFAKLGRFGEAITAFSECMNTHPEEPQPKEMFHRAIQTIFNT